LRLGRWRGWKACPWLMALVQLFCNTPIFHNEGSLSCLETAFNKALA
jgi:hypothetical protein